MAGRVRGPPMWVGAPQMWVGALPPWGNKKVIMSHPLTFLVGKRKMPGITNSIVTKLNEA